MVEYPRVFGHVGFFSWLLLHRMVVISGRYRIETSFFTRGISLIAVANAFGMEIPNGTSSAEGEANAPGTERELQETERTPSARCQCSLLGDRDSGRNAVANHDLTARILAMAVDGRRMRNGPERRFNSTLLTVGHPP